jgi:DNA modification methylase
MVGLTILNGDCLDILPTLPAQSVQCCVTSPPYWGLRDYGTAEWEGGDAGCEHTTTRRDQGEEKQSTSNGTSRDSLAGLTECRMCGACRIDSQLGLEATPQEYLDNMVAVFREVWRVLRADGTCWINLGDSYAGAKVGNTNSGSSSTLMNDGRPEASRLRSCAIREMDMATLNFRKTLPPGLKPKDLCMMPARLAMALQADGWYLRSDIIWHKPNPMPESVQDRPTRSHEFIFLLTKQERYFYDAAAIREPAIYAGDIKATNGNDGMCNGFDGHRTRDGFKRGVTVKDFRNKRTVWTIATQPYADAHFATFPEGIPKLCILAGSRPGDMILDPFAGSGTVGKVALELGRLAVLIELNPEYVQLAEVRTNVTPGFF